MAYKKCDKITPENVLGSDGDDGVELGHGSEVLSREEIRGGLLGPAGHRLERGDGE